MSDETITSSRSTGNLTYGLSATEVMDYINTLEIEPSGNLEKDHFPALNVSIAQVKMREYNSLLDYIREMNMIISKAARTGTHLLCLPAFTGLLPASLFLQYERIMQEHVNHENIGNPNDMWIYQAAVGLASECFEVYFTTMSALAAKHEIYIAAGSTIYKKSGNFVHRALLFSPQGKLVGVQDKFAPTIIDSSLQIEPANKLEVMETEFGRVAMIIGDDIDYFELTKVAYAQGAQLIINPSIFPAPYTSIKAAEGINLRVQEYPVFGIQPTMIGTMRTDNKFAGASGIYAPSKMVGQGSKNCRLYSTLDDERTQIITHSLFFNKLRGKGYENNLPFMLRNIDYIY